MKTNDCMRTGTCYFRSIEDVIRYYAKQGIDATTTRLKIAANEVYIGVPHLNGNESIELDNDGRFFIVTK